MINLLAIQPFKMKKILFVLLMQVTVFAFGQNNKNVFTLKDIVFDGTMDYKNKIEQASKESPGSRALTRILPNKEEKTFKYILEEKDGKSNLTAFCYLISKDAITSELDLFKFKIDPLQVIYLDPRFTKAKEAAAAEGKTIKITMKIKETPVNLNTTSDNFSLATGGDDDCICTDWYWDYYHNDEFLYTEYDHTECYCFGSFGGGSGLSGNGGSDGGPAGGGGSGGGSTPPNNLSCEDFANEGTAIEGPLIEDGGVNEGSFWQKTYNWKIFVSGTWGIFSYELAVFSKVYYEDLHQSRWEFRELIHKNMAAIGSVYGGTRTFVDLGGVSNIMSGRTSAWMNVSYTVTSAVVGNLAGLCPPVTLAYNANKRFVAPNDIAIIGN